MKPPEAPLRVLLVEDSEHDAELVLRRLRRAGLRVASKRVASEDALRAALARERDYDAVIMDYTVPGLDAPRTLELLHELRSELPCIVVSCTIGEEVAVQTLRLGAADYLLKDRLARLPSAVLSAIERGEFVLHLQPRVSLRDGRIVGAEALVRWNDPARGLVPPAEFIPVAEETGLIVPIGEWVLSESCRLAAAWKAEGFGGLHVSVNVSARQFRTGDLARTIREVLRRAGLDAAGLELELTESLIMDNAAAFISTLRGLREIGVGLSIDDFGTGYSSLSYLKQFPVDKLKIDQSFVRDIPGDPDDAAIAQAVIDLGRSLGLKVIAEGVETRAQLDFLRERGCDEAQGYFLGRPGPQEEFLQALRRSPHAGLADGMSENV